MYLRYSFSVDALTSSSNSRLSSATPRGSCDASSTASRMRFASAGLGMAQFYVNRGEAFGLRNLDQQLSRQLEQREEGDHQDRDPSGRLEQLGELEDAALAQAAQDAAHVLAHRQLFAGNVVVPGQARAVQEAAPGLGKILRVDLRQALGDRLFYPQRDRDHVAADLRQLVERAGGLLDSLVLEQPPHQLGARVLLRRLERRRPRQQQARLDLHQHRRHHQVLGGELQVLRAHDLDVLEVLARERRHRDVEDVEVFLADQVQQQVERPFEGLENHLEGIGRDVEVARQLDDRLAVELRHHVYESPIASRTSRMVSAARRFALSQPSAMMFFTSVGSSTYACARSRIGASSAWIASITGCLHSRQPMPAVVQPCHTHFFRPSSEYTLCNSQTGHFSGLPGSLRFTRAGSVGMVRIFFATDSGSSRSEIVLP